MFSSFSANLPFIQVLCGADYHTHINTCFCLLRYAKSSQKISTSLSLSSSPRRRVWIFDVTSKVQRHITQLFCYCSGSLHCFSETQLTRVVKLFLHNNPYCSRHYPFHSNILNIRRKHTWITSIGRGHDLCVYFHFSSPFFSLLLRPTQHFIIITQKARVGKSVIYCTNI